MKIIALFLIQCVWSLAVEPKPVSPEHLKQALKKYEGLETLETSFKQVKTVKGMDLKLDSEGTLKITFPNKVEWKVTKPEKVTVVLIGDRIQISSDGKTQEFRASEGSAKDQAAFQDLLRWLKLDADGILRAYNVMETSGGQKPRVFNFIPKESAGVPLKNLFLTLSADGHMEKLFFNETSGDDIAIKFSKPKLKYRATR